MKTEKERITWINYIRAICMFLVYFYHTENRANFDFLDRSFDLFFKPFFVNVFFIVSGYLLFRKQGQLFSVVPNSRIWLKEYGKDYLLKILFTLTIPTIMFSSILFFPKILLRHQTFNLSTFLDHTFGGGSLWFTSALVVAQLLVFVLLYFRKFKLTIWGGYGVVLFTIAIVLHKLLECENAPWYYQSGMCSVSLIWFGALIYEDVIHDCLGNQAPHFCKQFCLWNCGNKH